MRTQLRGRDPRGRPDGVEQGAVPLVRRHWKGKSFPLSQAQGVPWRVAAGDVRPKGGILTEHGPVCGFEIEAATVEDFLRLLKEREGRAAPEGSRSPLRRAVFLARILDQRSSRFGYPLVTRRVVAA